MADVCACVYMGVFVFVCLRLHECVYVPVCVCVCLGASMQAIVHIYPTYLGVSSENMYIYSEIYA